jgi:hypothetical protein
MEFVKIKGTNIIRNLDNLSLVNMDKNELDEYILKKNIMLEQKKEINSIKSEISSLKSDINELKQLIVNNLIGKN